MSATDIDSQDLITVEEAAAALQTTNLRVLMLLKEKALVGAEIDGTWFVTRESLKCCMAHGRDMKVRMGDARPAVPPQGAAASSCEHIDQTEGKVPHGNSYQTI